MFSCNLNRFWHVIPTGGDLFEVRNGSKAFKVDEQHRTCTCRLWQLSGLPCAHAIAVIFKLNRRVEDYVPGCFRKQSFYSAYHQYLTPVGGMDFWPDCSEMSRVLPPKPKKMPGRPRKKRIRAAHENKNSNRVSRSGITMTCKNCFQKGHNKKGCKNPTVVLPPKPPTKKGRPRKAQVGVSSLVDEDLDFAPVDSAPVETTPIVDDDYVEAPFVHEQTSQFEVGGSSNGRSKRVKTTLRRGRIGNKGRLPPTTQHHVNTQQSQNNAPNADTASGQSNQAPDIASHVAVPNIPPRPRMNFVKPRQRSERIFKRKLAKNIGSSNSNGL